MDEQGLEGRAYLGREDFSLPCAEKNNEVGVGGAIKRWAKEGAIYEARALRGLEGLGSRGWSRRTSLGRKKLPVALG